jgi:hypothetical protein
MTTTPKMNNESQSVHVGNGLLLAGERLVVIVKDQRGGVECPRPILWSYGTVNDEESANRPKREFIDTTCMAAKAAGQQQVRHVSVPSLTALFPYPSFGECDD